MKYFMLMLCLLCSVCFGANQLFIFFINGVNTTPAQAEINLSKLEDIVDVDSSAITWNVLYNATHGLVRADVWDVINQKREERLRLSYTAYKKKYPTNTLEDYLLNTRYVGKNLADLVNQFHNRIPKDRTDLHVLIVSHSQGNQYANQLYDYLVNGEGFPKDRIALIGIATPTSMGEGNSFFYVTADNDKIINMVRLFPESPLPANVHIKECHDISCHNFINDYLGDASIRSAICRRIGSYMNLWLNTQPLC